MTSDIKFLDEYEKVLSFSKFNLDFNISEEEKNKIDNAYVINKPNNYVQQIFRNCGCTFIRDGNQDKSIDNNIPDFKNGDIFIDDYIQALIDITVKINKTPGGNNKYANYNIINQKIIRVFFMKVMSIMKRDYVKIVNPRISLQASFYDDGSGNANLEKQVLYKRVIEQIYGIDCKNLCEEYFKKVYNNLFNILPILCLTSENDLSAGTLADTIKQSNLYNEYFNNFLSKVRRNIDYEDFEEEFYLYLDDIKDIEKSKDLNEIFNKIQEYRQGNGGNIPPNNNHKNIYNKYFNIFLKESELLYRILLLNNIGIKDINYALTGPPNASKKILKDCIIELKNNNKNIYFLQSFLKLFIEKQNIINQINNFELVDINQLLNDPNLAEWKNLPSNITDKIELLEKYIDNKLQFNFIIKVYYDDLIFYPSEDYNINNQMFSLIIRLFDGIIKEEDFCDEFNNEFMNLNKNPLETIANGEVVENLKITKDEIEKILSEDRINGNTLKFIFDNLLKYIKGKKKMNNIHLFYLFEYIVKNCVGLGIYSEDYLRDYMGSFIEKFLKAIEGEELYGKITLDVEEYGIKINNEVDSNVGGNEVYKNLENLSYNLTFLNLFRNEKYEIDNGELYCEEKGGNNLIEAMRFIMENGFNKKLYFDPKQSKIILCDFIGINIKDFIDKFTFENESVVFNEKRLKKRVKFEYKSNFLGNGIKIYPEEFDQIFLGKLVKNLTVYVDLNDIENISKGELNNKYKECLLKIEENGKKKVMKKLLNEIGVFEFIDPKYIHFHKKSRIKKKKVKEGINILGYRKIVIKRKHKIRKLKNKYSINKFSFNVYEIVTFIMIYGNIWKNMKRIRSVSLKDILYAVYHSILS